MLSGYFYGSGTCDLFSRGSQMMGAIAGCISLQETGVVERLRNIFIISDCHLELSQPKYQESDYYFSPCFRSYHRYNPFSALTGPVPLRPTTHQRYPATPVRPWTMDHRNSVALLCISTQLPWYCRIFRLTLSVEG